MSNRERAEWSKNHPEVMHLIDIKEKALEEALVAGNDALIDKRVKEYKELITELKFTDPFVDLNYEELGLKAEARALNRQHNQKSGSSEILSQKEASEIIDYEKKQVEEVIEHELQNKTESPRH